MRRRVLLVCAAVAGLVIPAAATAIPAPPATGMPAGVETDGDSFWTSAVVADKRAFAARINAAAAALAGQSAASDRSTQSARQLQLTGYRSIGVLGSSVDVWFDDNHNIHRGWFSFCVTFDNGSGYTGWYGLNPFYARHLTYTQRWTFNGIGVSVSIPGGANFSGSGDTVRWSRGYDTVWYVTHGYTGVEGCVGVLGIMYNVHEAHSGDWQLTYTTGQYVQASASANVI